MQRTKAGSFSAVALLGLAAAYVPFAPSAQGSVLYGNFVAPDVTYQAVAETPTQLPGPTPPDLFGAPALSGDSLVFSPLNFVVAASGGASEFQDGRLTMNILPAVQSNLTSLVISEGGGWTVGGGTSATTAMEALLVNQLFITSVNGVSVNPVVVPPRITYTDTNSGTATVATTPDTIQFASTPPFSTGTWDGQADFDIATALRTAGLRGTVTGLTLDLDNELAVTSETNSSAFIDKKFFNVTTVDSAVPEPATLTPIAIAALGLLSRRRTRKALIPVEYRQA